MAREKAKPVNPFVPSLLARGRHFADRKAEVERIRSAYHTPGARLVVFGERRMGKTSTLERAAELERKAGTSVAVASFATATDAADAARQILLAVREEIGRDWRASLESIVGRLHGGIEVRPSAVPGLPPSLHITFGLRDEAARPDLIPETLNAINEHVEGQKGHLAVALDEFQRVHEWGGENAEWAFKAVLERHRSVSYVMAGSQRRLIEAMVTSKGRALWKQADVLTFGAIDAEELAEWIHQEATRTAVVISLELCDEIVRVAGPRTRDVVQLAREVWFQNVGGDAVKPAAIERAVSGLVQVQAALYATIWRERSPTEQRILRASLLEPGLALTSAAALKRYQLGPKSTVQSSIARLVDGEYLIALPDGGYAFDDPFFRHWIQTSVVPGLGLQ